MQNVFKDHRNQHFTMTILASKLSLNLVLVG